MRAKVFPVKVRKRAGFALRELVAVVCVGVLLLMLVSPCLGRMRVKGDATVCRANARDLAYALTLYCKDNSGAFPDNFTGAAAMSGNTVPSLPFPAPWALGWLDWSTSPHNTNMLFLRDRKYAKLAPYIAAKRNVHKCPTDRYLNRMQAQRAGRNECGVWR